MKTKFFYILLIFQLWSFSGNAQCNSVTITIQTEIDLWFFFFGCSTINGDLIIDGAQVNNLVALDGMLTTVTGNVIIRNTTVSNLSGIENLVIGGGITLENNQFLNTTMPSNTIFTPQNIIISNNQALTDLNFFNNVTSVGNNLNIIDCPNLGNEDFSFFDNLTNVGNEIIIENTGITDWTSGNNLVSATNFFDFRFNSELVTFDGFNNVADASFIRFWANDKLESIDGFDNLTTLSGAAVIDFVANPVLATIDGFNNISTINNFLFQQNIILTEINGFSNLNTVQDNFVLINNLNFSDCCFILDLSIPNAINIDNNALGCESLAAIGAEPPVINCVPDFTVGLDPANSCLASYIMTDPTPTDDCGVVGGTFERISPSGVINGGTLAPGFDWPQNTAEVGDWTFTYTATDQNNLTSTCTTIVTVADINAPTWNDPSLVTTITGICGLSDPDLLAIANTPTAVDDCGIATVSLDSQSSVIVCGASTSTTYTYSTTDDVGNLNPQTFEVIVILEDLEVPTLSGIPADVTIACDEAFPAIPSPTAMDQCAGDITSLISVTSSISLGDCSVGTPAEIHNYSWSIDDGCGNIATGNWEVTVLNDFSIELGPDVILCNQPTYVIDAGAGNSFSWSTGETSQTITVSSSDMYSVTVTSTNGCCSIDDVMITFGTEPNALAVGGELDCSGNPIMIQGNSTTPNVTFGWTGPGGFTSPDQNPSVTAVGDYILTVTDQNGCASTAVATVTANTNVPDITAVGNVLDCSGETINVFGNSMVSGVSYSWIGPNGFTSTDQSPVVTDAGIYTLNITAPNNCVATATAEVIDDTAEPDLTVEGENIDCMNPTTMLSASSSVFGVTYSWEGPNGFTSMDPNPSITEGGDYIVTVTAPNSCFNIGGINIAEDFVAPDVTAMGGMLDCNATFITITSNSTTAGVTYSWVGPNGFTSMQQNTNVVDAGDYTVTVIGPNGCMSSETVTVTENTDAPDISATGGMLNCLITEVQLTGSSSVSNVTYMWTGPGGFMSDEQNPFVSTGGTYTLTINAPNGCSSTTTTEVIADLEEPQISASGGTITCAMDAELMGSSTTVDATFSWTGPNGFMSNETNPLVSEPGTYILSVVGPNGCGTTISVSVVEDIEEPQASAQGGTIDCSNPNTQLMSSSTTAGASFSWEGPNGFMSDEMNPIVSEVGVYVVTVLAPNGCSTSVSVEVIADGDLPQVSATGGTIDCNNPTVQLMGSSTTEGVQFNWSGPGGFMTDEMNPTVSEPGTYTLFVSSDNGCGISINVLVIDDTQEPEVTLSLGDANCDEGTRLINAVSNVEGLDVMWTGPNGFTSTELSPSISDAGTYTLETFPMNGCNSNHSITMNDYVNYTEEINTIDITDSNTTGQAEIIITGGTAPFSILWDNGQTGTSVVDLTEGEHTVEVTDGLGCVRVFDFFIDNLVATFEAEWIEDINLYPNPATEYVNIEFSTSSQYFDVVHIYNVHGQLMKEISLDKGNERISFSVNEWTTGVYVARIFADKSSYSLRFIVE